MDGLDTSDTISIGMDSSPMAVQRILDTTRQPQMDSGGRNALTRQWVMYSYNHHMQA